MRKIANKRELNDEKLSLMDLLIQYGDINKEQIVGEITTIIGAATDTTSTACGYVLVLLVEKKHIQARTAGYLR
jgi:cytochrome P450